MSRAEPIGKVLSEVVQELGIAKRIREQRAVVDWRELVGDHVAEHSRAVRVDGGNLFVEVGSSVWAQELTLMRRKILEEINARIGANVIQSIHFVLGGAGFNDAPRSRDSED